MQKATLLRKLPLQRACYHRSWNSLRPRLFLRQINTLKYSLLHKFDEMVNVIKFKDAEYSLFQLHFEGEMNKKKTRAK